MKQGLLQMIEWHGHLAAAPQRDVWPAGRFLSAWADPRIQDFLPATFAGADPHSLREALFASLDLFRWLARETAGKLGVPFPDLVEERTRELIKEIML